MQQKFIDGTAAELINRGIIINGVKATAVDFSILAKLGIVQTIGKAPKIQGKRGKQGAIYRVSTVPGFVEFTVDYLPLVV